MKFKISLKVLMILIKFKLIIMNFLIILIQNKNPLYKKKKILNLILEVNHQIITFKRIKVIKILFLKYKKNNINNRKKYNLQILDFKWVNLHLKDRIEKIDFLMEMIKKIVLINKVKQIQKEKILISIRFIKNKK